MKTPTEEQQKVIVTTDRDILLRAPAGTGKTFTIARKIAEAIKRGDVSGEDVLCLTFTKKAACEMAEEIEAETGVERVAVLTVHGFCYRVLADNAKALGLPSRVNVCDEADAEDILHKRVLKEMFDLYGTAKLQKAGIDICGASLVMSVQGNFYHKIDTAEGAYPVGRNGEKYCPEELELRSTFACPFCGKEISESTSCPHCGEAFDEYVIPVIDCKMNLYALVGKVRHYREFYGICSDSEKNDYKETYARLCEEFPEEMHRLFEMRYAQDPFEAYAPTWIGALVVRYLEELDACGLVDFDGLLLKAFAALSCGGAAENYGKRIRLLIVDEMQDTSRLEYEIISQLFGDNQVVLCGDVNQSIYGWRGAEPNEVINRFKTERNPIELSLCRNYRSSVLLADAANAFLNSGGNFSAAVIQEAVDPDAPIEIHVSATPEAQVEFVYRSVSALTPEARKKSCVLARGNRSINTFCSDVEALRAGDSDAPQFVKGEEERDFFKNPIAKDYLSVFRLLVNPFDADALERFAVSRLGVTCQAVAGISRMGSCGISITDFLRDTADDPFAALADSLKDGRCVVFDLETTGLDVTFDEAIQIAAIMIDAAGNVTDRFLRYVKTDRKISPQALATHGITAEVLDDQGIDRAVALEEFAAFCKDCVAVGYNSAAFDLGMVQIECRRHSVHAAIRAHYDVMEIAKRLYPNLPNYKLSTLCAEFGIINKKAHDAMSDVEATAEVMLAEYKTLVETSRNRTRALKKNFSGITRFGTYLAQWRERIFEPCGDLVTRQITQTYGKPTDEYRAVEAVFCRLLHGDQPLFETIQQLLMRTLDGNALWNRFRPSGDRIPVLTIHQAKGCEFETVFLIDADGDNFPNRYSVKERGEKAEREERRIFYVALTRAEKNIVASYSATKFVPSTGKRRAVRPSPYFNLIPSRLIKRT